MNHVEQLTGGCVHSSPITNNDAIAVKTFGKSEEGVLHLNHRFQQIFLKCDSCVGGNKVKSKCG